MIKAFKILSSMLVLVFSISLALLFTPAKHMEAASLSELRDRRDQIKKELEASEQDLADLEGQNNSLTVELGKLKKEQSVEQEAYDALLLELETAKKNLEAAIKAHLDAVKRLETKQEEYENRVTALFRIRNKSTLEVMLEADSVDGFFTNMRLMSYIGQVDQSLLSQLDYARQEAEQAKNNAETTKEEYDAFVLQKELQLEELSNGISMTETNIDDLSGKILTRSSEITKLQHQEQETTDDIDSLMAEIAADDKRKKDEEALKKAVDNSSASSSDSSNEVDIRSNQDGTEAMIYPLPNYTGISDGFGWRPDPFSNTGSYMHWGLDFPAPAGTSIRAALSGTVGVVSAPYQGSVYGGNGFGNYCTIVAPDGVALIYAHQTNVLVSVGQYVSQGEVIGTVGSTGFSTGPHLHFQMRVPWSTDSGIDPTPFLP